MALLGVGLLNLSARQNSLMQKYRKKRKENLQRKESKIA